MARSHAQLFANQILARAVFENPLAITRAIASGDIAATLAPLWEQAGSELPPISRKAPAGGFSATLERRGLYSIAMITPPAPRDSGEPAALVIIGRGDGATKLTTVAYYVLELVLDATTRAPSFTIVSRTGLDERGMICGDGPLPDSRWLAQHAFDLYAGRTAAAATGIPELPSWYWWHTFDGAGAVRSLAEAGSTVDRFEIVRKAPILLLPEIGECAELFADAKIARSLRDLQPYLRREPALASAWQALAQRLACTISGHPVANAIRALPAIADARQYGALSRAQGYELEASVRSRLVSLGVDPAENAALSQQLYEAARAADRGPRLARGSAAPPIGTDDPVWKPLFLDETDLPQCARAEHDEAFSSCEPLFVAHGGLRAGYAVWTADAYAAMAHLVDARWVFRTATAAAYFLRAAAASFADGLPMLPAPPLGDEALAFGGEVAGGQRAHVLVVRVGRVVARLQVTEGVHAAACAQILHTAMLHPLAHKIAQRARTGLAAYWLAVAYPTNAVAALVHSPGHDAARLLQKYPLLAHAELPAAMTILGDQYAPVARSLASFQAQVRAHRWATYRDSMLALVRLLLSTDMGDPRVNAAHAHEIVSEVRYLDSDPVWLQLDTECRARS